ncbi:acyl carrier protein [Streptomyces europaeiscabiei]|uniref:acyl carrier protein n=1 Tax=Streptomyces europaeiscabiei TaxID=146819 RepID=UPI002E17F2C3
MSADMFTIDILRRILLEGAGADDEAAITGDISQMSFEELGYDSLAALETGARIGREYGLELEDSTILDTDTLGELVTSVNQQIQALRTV